MIDTIALKLLRLPLKAPYKLAFGKVTQFDTILAHVSADGSEGVGEATILTGYTDETIESSWTCALDTARKLPGSSNEAAKVTIENGLKSAPFTATALTTAIEMAESHPALQVKKPTQVPLLAGINAMDEAGNVEEIEQAIKAGFGTLKIKVGFDVHSDLQRVAFIQKSNAGRARLRIDANQGYDRNDGCHFASSINSEDIELLEQPCHMHDWEALETVAKVTQVPLMLDESIYSVTDIERAARIGASFVKLKLMKFVSLDRLERGLALIHDLGMEPVLGNGVASDIGCWMEACVARRKVSNAGEMNGFLRQVESLAHPPLKVVDGAIQLSPGAAPQLCEATLKQGAVATALFDRTSEMIRTVT